jgi:general secretion pathway protein D
VAQPGAVEAGAGSDPMAAVKQGMKEIEFRPKEGGNLVAFNLDDADLPDLVKAISNMTGKRFIYGGKLRQVKATVYSPEKISRAEAYAAFLSILETNGMTVIPQGRFLKIVETPGIVSQGTPILSPATPVPAEDRYVTRLYRLTNIDATETSALLQKYKSKDGDITPYPGGNLLIITDTGSNIQRMLRIVEEIDVGGAGELLWVEPVHYGAASDVATKLNEILDIKSGGSGKGSGGRVGGPRIIADDRTNTLIVAATETDYRRLLELVKRLDAPQTGDGQIHVLPLQHAACQDLSNTLNQILGGGGGAAKAGRASGAKGGTPARCRAPPRTSSRVRSASPATRPPTLSSPRLRCATTPSCAQRDRQARSAAPPGLHRGGDHGRERGPLDRRGPRLPRRRALHDAEPEGQRRLRRLQPAASAISGLPANLEALAVGVRGPAIDGARRTSSARASPSPRSAWCMHALAKDGDSNVLATPHILATDNVPAEISIGQNIPLQTNVGAASRGSLLGARRAAQGGRRLGRSARSAASAARGGLGFQAPRQDMGTKIKVTPHVNDSDQVRLELVEEISDAGAPLGSLGADPHQQAHRQHDAHRARSADGGHRRPGARRHHQRRDQDPHPRRHPRARRCSSSRRRRRRPRATCCSSSRPT